MNGARVQVDLAPLERELFTHTHTGLESSIDALDQGSAQKGLIANALTDPANTTAGQFLKSKIASQLSPKSREYVTNVLSMREQIMGLNQLLTGTSGTSDSRIKAIWDTLPNGSEPDSDMGRRKMKLVRGMIGNVKEAFPMMKMIPGQQDNSGGGIVRFKDSQGGLHDIPSINLDKARQRDPGLQVVSQ